MKTPLSDEAEFIGFKDFGLISDSGTSLLIKAENTLLARIVLIKILKLSPDLPQDAITRFKTDAQILATVSHENIVKVHKYGVLSSGAPFVIMDYVNGKKIREFISFALMPEAVACVVFAQICRALSEAQKFSLGLESFQDVIITYEQQSPDKKTTSSKNLLRYRPYLFNLKHDLSQSVDSTQKNKLLAATIIECITGKELSDLNNSSDLIKSSQLSSRMQKLLLRLLDDSPDRQFHNLDDIADKLQQLSEIQLTGEKLRHSRTTPLALGMISVIFLFLILFPSVIKSSKQTSSLPGYSTIAEIKDLIITADKEEHNRRFRESALTASTAVKMAHARHAYSLEVDALRILSQDQSEQNDDKAATNPLTVFMKLKGNF